MRWRSRGRARREHYVGSLLARVMPSCTARWRYTARVARPCAVTAWGRGDRRSARARGQRDRRRRSRFAPPLLRGTDGAQHQARRRGRRAGRSGRSRGADSWSGRTMVVIRVWMVVACAAPAPAPRRRRARARAVVGEEAGPLRAAGASRLERKNGSDRAAGVAADQNRSRDRRDVADPRMIGAQTSATSERRPMIGIRCDASIWSRAVSGLMPDGAVARLGATLERGGRRELDTPRTGNRRGPTART